MLADSKLPHRFWAEALSTAVYLRNRSPTKALEGITPYEAWSGTKPDVSSLRIFGCSAYAHVPKAERRKLDSKAGKCVLLGYGTNQKGYRLYDLGRMKVIHSRDVVFELPCLDFRRRRRPLSNMWSSKSKRSQLSRKLRLLILQTAYLKSQRHPIQLSRNQFYADQHETHKSLTGTAKILRWLQLNSKISTKHTKA